VATRNVLGFPSCGQVAILIEHNIGQVGITFGPFSGGDILSYTISATQSLGVDGSQDVTLVNRVQVSRATEGQSVYLSRTICLGCDLIGDLLKRWYLPSTLDFMQQTVSSMENLAKFITVGGIDVPVIRSIEGRCVSVSADDNNARSPLLTAH